MVIQADFEPPTGPDVYQKLAVSLSQNNWDEAFVYLADVCERFPNHGAAWELRGLMEAQFEHPNMSIHCFEQASLLTPLEPWSCRIHALQHLTVGRRRLGLDLLAELGRAEATPPMIVRLVAQDLIDLGCPARAAEVLMLAVDRHPDSAMLWHELAVTQTVLREDVECCLQAVARAILLEPGCAEYRVTAAYMLIHMDLPEDAYRCATLIPEASLEQLDCPCCLWRLICLFDCYGDDERVQQCYALMNRPDRNAPSQVRVP